MKSRDWQTLLHSLQQGDCILVLGPEMPISVGPSNAISGAGQLPETARLSVPEMLAEQLSRELEIADLDRYDLAQVAEFYWRQYGRNDLEAEVVSFLRKAPANELYTHLAGIPFNLIISLAHDTGLAAALSEQGRTPIVETYDFRGDQKEVLGLGRGAIGTPQQPLVYKLYGHVGVPRSLVLTESDVLDFLTAIISRNPDLPNDLRSVLRDKSKNFVLLGCGLKKWYLRILLHLLKVNQKDTRSFALEPIAAAAQTDLKKTVLFMRKGMRVESYDYDVGQFVRDLEARCQAEGMPAGGGAPAPSLARSDTGVEAPKIFISYASEDEANARRLHEALKAAGFDPWYDQEGLRGGDRWDEVIQDVLDEVDYVIVVESAALYNKTFSYVNREINLALKRQQLARRGIRYLIPVHIDDSPLLTELKEIQAIQLAGDVGLEKLRTAIERDQQRRKTRYA